MPITNVEIRHRCGCVRPYALELPPSLVASVTAQLQQKHCGYTDCPLAAERLLAKRAPANVNGKGEP